jgi:hypothetical protein
MVIHGKKLRVDLIDAENFNEKIKQNKVQLIFSKKGVLSLLIQKRDSTYAIIPWVIAFLQKRIETQQSPYPLSISSAYP